MAWLYSIEWQNCGLPHVHVHVLLWLISDTKLHLIKLMTSYVCTEILDPVNDPALHQIIMSNMVHGPYGSINLTSPCVEHGQ